MATKFSSDMIHAERQWLAHLEPSQTQSSTGAVTMALSEPGLVTVTISGTMDRTLAQDFISLLNQLYDQLEHTQQQVILLIDASALDSLSLTAQSVIFSSRGRGLASAVVVCVHCVLTKPFFRSVIRLWRSLNPASRQQLLAHESLTEALSFITPELHHSQDDLAGPELSEEAFNSDHVSLQYLQPSPQILLCRGAGIINASAAHHMIDVNARLLAAQRRHFGRAILIIDSIAMRHSTIEAYRVMRGEVGAAAPGPNDIICVITHHWPKAVAKIVATLLPHLGFGLIIAGSLEEALSAIENRRRQPVVSRPRTSSRLAWFRLRRRLREQEAEITQLKLEREQFLGKASQLVGDILLHKQPDEMPRLPESELRGPYQEVYESLYMLQHDYQEYLKTLQQEIDERIQAEHRAAELSQIKTRFLGSVSHELRTPLNAIIGFSNLVLKGKAGPITPQQQRFLERVHDNSMHLLALINDVLDISKIESGTVAVSLESVPVQNFLERVLEPLQLASARKGLGLHLIIDPQAQAQIQSDPDRLRQIISNLVNNALKFTNNGEITVTYRRWDAPAFPLAFEVRDTGIGIAKEDQKKVFEAFTQAHQGPYAGTGLGLSICVSLCYVLGYQIELESEAGQGSLFRVLIPAV